MTPCEAIGPDEAFERGHVDEMAGVSWLANPYEDGTVEARRWVDGKVKAIQDKRLTEVEINVQSDTV